MSVYSPLDTSILSSILHLTVSCTWPRSSQSVIKRRRWPLYSIQTLSRRLRSFSTTSHPSHIAWFVVSVIVFAYLTNAGGDGFFNLHRQEYSKVIPPAITNLDAAPPYLDSAILGISTAQGASSARLDILAYQMRHAYKQ